jgi:hypothetical protein
LLNSAVNESKTKIETNASNIGTIGGVNGAITSLDGRVTVLEEAQPPDYTADISNLND